MEEKMEAGEMEMRKAFEEVTTRNVQASIGFSNETRKMVRDLEVKIKDLENIILSKDNVINEMRKQISLIQQKLYTGGSS